jgi:hypothetical protein
MDPLNSPVSALRAGAALMVASCFAVSACSATVDSEPEDAGVSRGPWTCDRSYGPVRRTSSAQALHCKAGAICAVFDGDQWACCPLDDPMCGGDGPGNDEPSFYCFPGGGLSRENTSGHYPVCKADEICALHNTADCNYTCCSLADDPDCGVPSKKSGCGLQ